MKLFSAFVAVALAGKNEPNKGGQNPGKNPPGTCTDKNTALLDALSGQVTDKMTEMHGADSLTEPWRKKLQRQRDQLVDSCKRDYCGRIEQGNCKADKVHEFKKTDDVFDIVEKELPEDCKGNPDVELMSRIRNRYAHKLEPNEQRIGNYIRELSYLGGMTAGTKKFEKYRVCVIRTFTALEKML